MFYFTAMKSIVYSIINESLFNSKICEVDTTKLTSSTKSFKGQLVIKTKEDETINYYGDFDVFDFLKEYGFILHSKLFLKP